MTLKKLYLNTTEKILKSKLSPIFQLFNKVLKKWRTLEDCETPQHLQDMATLLFRAYHVCLCNFIFSCVLFVFDFEILWKMICRCIRGFCIFNAALVLGLMSLMHAYGSLNAMLSLKERKKIPKKMHCIKGG